MGFWGALIGAGVFDTVLLSRMPVGHTHNGADGEISHVSRHTRGTKKGRAKTNGHDIASVQGFRRMLDQVYNAKHKRLLSAPIFAAVLGWKEFFTGTFQKDLGGFSSTFRHDNPSKEQEVHHIYLFKNAAGRVVFQYKTLRDLNLDRPWRGGAAGIDLFEVECPDLRSREPHLTGWSSEFMGFAA